MSNIPLDQRVLWMGASDVAALFDVSPFTTRFELWHIKKGNIPREDLDDNERVQAGKFLEPAIAAWATYKWDWPLYNVEKYLQHPGVAQFGASLDFETDAGEPTEIKNVDRAVFFKEYVADGDELLDAPVYHLIQIQSQIACKEERPDNGWLLVCVGGNKLYRMKVPRHDGLIARIEKEVGEFWKSVHEDREPKPNFEVDANTISLLYAHQGDEVVDMRGNNEFTMLCAEYLSAHEVEKSGSKRKSTALAEIKTMMGDAKTAVAADGFKVSASMVKGSVSERKPHRRFSVTQKQDKI